MRRVCKEKKIFMLPEGECKFENLTLTYHEQNVFLVSKYTDCNHLIMIKSDRPRCNNELVVVAKNTETTNKAYVSILK